MTDNISNSDVYKEDESGEPVDEPVEHHRLKVRERLDSKKTITDEVNNVRYADPGEVQTEIDNVAAASPAEGVVKLRPEKSYDFTGVAVKDGVALHYNGAINKPTTDATIHTVHPDGRVFAPRIDYSGLTTFTSTVFLFDTANGQFFNDDETRVVGGFTIGTLDSGTLVHIHASTTGNLASMIQVEGHKFKSVATPVDLEAVSGESVNGNFIELYGDNYVTGIRTHGAGTISDNHIEGAWDTASSSTTFWDLDTGQKNIVKADIFDTGNLTDVWNIATGAGSDNKIITTETDTSKITDNKNDASNSVIESASHIERHDNTTLVIGDGATTTNDRETGFGDSVTASGAKSTAIGNTAKASGQSSVAVGHTATANSTGAIAIGQSTTASGSDSIIIGVRGESASANYAIGIGGSVSTAQVCRIGEGDGTNRCHQLVFPGVRDTIADTDLLTGELTVELDETNNAFRLRGKDSGGTVREATVAW